MTETLNPILSFEISVLLRNWLSLQERSLKRRKRNEKALIKEDDFTAAPDPVTANRICLGVDLAFLVSLSLKVFI